MIKNQEEFEHTQEQISRLERVLATMKGEESPEDYRLLSESYIDQIRRMRREIDAYLGVMEGEAVA
ncbi:MAG: hypothetical protein A3F84_03860 [Candidatus Handelsmanbacteria bacterium RIFCSPLOWO2_12_FULL_64_10]|uniref:Uncharacterized protein n=1 Tax=Handelsmanbacteria sp. (strain RIFCSPLOWO2_12_FULL_64_10) TaxID=1817868 RepID=A0A1F6CSW3_HANXR|nr:MAG: hypothetical protein A3F84_03860 [Candidatus Handelsmanbacteria bacterium RIFCSPLOWO2_12_FULL_64_10]